MKTVKREILMKHLAAAALMLGIYSPMAEAALSPKEGVSSAELSQIVQNLEIQQDGRNLSIVGAIPKHCAENAVAAYDYQNGAHHISVRMPNCEANFKLDPNEETVDTADIFAPIQLKDASGKIMLRHYQAGSRLASNRIQDEDILGKDGKTPIEYVSTATLEEQKAKEDEAANAEAERKAAEAEAKEKAKKFDTLSATLVSYCQDGDFVGMGAEVNAATDLLGDVTDMLGKVSDKQKKVLTDKLAKAESGADAKAAYEEFALAADENGWDQDAFKKDYLDKRFELINDEIDDVKSGDGKVASADKEIKDFMSDYRSTDRRGYTKDKDKFAEMYSQLGTNLANAGKVDEAVKFFDKARPLTNVQGRIKIDAAVSKLYTDQFKACVKQDPTKMDACEAKFVSKAKDRANAIKDALANQTGDDAETVKNAFNAEYISTFGGGISMTQPGFGEVMQQGGAIQQFKAQTAQEYQAQQQLKMQQMQQMQMMGIQPTAAASGSKILGF